MKAKKIWFEEEYILIETTTGKTGKMLLSWFPRLQKASFQSQMAFELWADGSWIHWEQIGEDLSVDGFFTYNKDMGI